MQHSLDDVRSNFIHDRATEFSLDSTSMGMPLTFLEKMEQRMQGAFDAMAQLEQGAIANPNEGRMVGHYWLRSADLAPTAEIRDAIVLMVDEVKAFAEAVHRGEIISPQGVPFDHCLVVGIGGSALGPQFVDGALRSSDDRMPIYFFDNTDPDGMAQTLADMPDASGRLVIVVSKSGSTKETRNGQLIAQAAFEESGLPYAGHCVAVTQEGSKLDRQAQADGWLKRFPMWDWVGGRTSEMSAVGLLPAALQGFDIDAMLAGARHMDELTRVRDTAKNPAAMLALSWYFAGDGLGDRNMVVLPYKDRLLLFSRYLQQLVMESLGKELALDGQVVNQGLSVYGNKGSTDQHAFVQQLREGRRDAFAIFIEVLAAQSSPTAESCAFNLEVEPGIRAADYLQAFMLGTEQALSEKGRQSLTITVKQVGAESIGMLIALFERAVGYYAHLINVNAYHQPGVEAGKVAAGEVLERQAKMLEWLREAKAPATVDEIAAGLGAGTDVKALFHILRRLAVNGDVKIAVQGAEVFDDRYSI